ncbi:carotenoid biosynthesis protein [Candidatus Thorarchaeota archaeon]|nr:MAG: carotenoid biosynthesis protein [Candidatus Thorarchaeota archaeon]
MSVRVGVQLTLVMVLVAATSTYLLWLIYGTSAGIQACVTLLIALAGEHYVSGQGYYHYTSKNGLFIGRVPLWIPFMWVAVVQLVSLVPILLGVPDHGICIVAGLLGCSLDLYLVEPVLCKIQRLWNWTPVKNGYFSFIPSQLNRFVAPIGNYFVWFLFPLLMALFLQICSLALC